MPLLCRRRSEPSTPRSGVSHLPLLNASRRTRTLAARDTLSRSIPFLPKNTSVATFLPLPSPAIPCPRARLQRPRAPVPSPATPCSYPCRSGVAARKGTREEKVRSSPEQRSSSPRQAPEPNRRELGRQGGREEDQPVPNLFSTP